MITYEQIQKVEKLCQNFKKSYQSNHSEITVTPYISIDKTKLIVHIYTAKHLDFYSFYDHWTLESPSFNPIFSGDKEKAYNTNSQILNLRKSLIDIFK